MVLVPGVPSTIGDEFNVDNLWFFYSRQAIILSTNKQEWLTIPKATLDGTCSSGLNERLSVTFKINMRSGCMIRYLIL